MTIWILCRFGLKCLFAPQKFWFWGVRTPKRDWSSSRPPKGTSLAETALTCQILCRSVHWCDLGACSKELKKRKKAMKETYCGKLGVRPDHPRWRSDMWSCTPGGLREVLLSFKFRQNRLNGFRDFGGRNLPFPILKAYIIAFVLQYKPWYTFCVTRVSVPLPLLK